MVTNRYLEAADYEALTYSLAQDEHHSQTPLEFFTAPGTVCSVYSDEKGIVLYARGSILFTESGDKLMKLDLQFVSNSDVRRNLKTMIDGLERLSIQAATNGFAAILFESSVESLRAFCCRRLGFRPVVDDWLVKVLKCESIQD